MKTIARVVATGFGTGYFPFAPGTVGSGIALLLYWISQKWMHVSFWTFWGVMIGCFLFGVWASTVVEKEVCHSGGKKDPSIVNWDEMVGMWISVAHFPFNPWVWGAGFLIFRLLDIVKPPPIRSLQVLPGGWGIMMDDCVAGMYTQLILQIIFHWIL